MCVVVCDKCFICIRIQLLCLIVVNLTMGTNLSLIVAGILLNQSFD